MNSLRRLSAPKYTFAALNSREEDEEKGTFKPAEEDTFQSGVGRTYYNYRIASRGLTLKF